MDVGLLRPLGLLISPMLFLQTCIDVIMRGEQSLTLSVEENGQIQIRKGSVNESRCNEKWIETNALNYRGLPICSEREAKEIRKLKLYKGYNNEMIGRKK